VNELKSVITWLERHSSKRTRDGMARYGIPSDNALGVTMADLKVLAKRVGRNHQPPRCGTPVYTRPAC
jgi:3-methyladenine DNA glycosylase AlkD